MFFLKWTTYGPKTKTAETHAVFGTEGTLLRIHEGLSLLPHNKHFEVRDLKSLDEEFKITAEGIIRKF